jgi:hypothetical protein
MNQNQITPTSGIPPLHKHGAFDDLDAALENIYRLTNALRGIGNLLQPEFADEQLNMARRSDASAVFEFFSEALREYREIAAEASQTLQCEAERAPATTAGGVK